MTTAPPESSDRRATPSPNKQRRMPSAKSIHDALKLSLSLVFFYWIALAADWPLPKYGAIAIVLISLGSTEASLKKGVLRIIGTTFGVAAGFLLLGLFAQDSVPAMMTMAAYLAVVAYFMQSSKYVYAWFVTGFVPLVVWSNTYMDVENTFYFGIYRYFETTVGVAVYTLVCLIWAPSTERDPQTANSKQAQTASKDAQDTERDGRLIKALFPAASFLTAFVFWVFFNPPTGPSIPMMSGMLGLVMLMSNVNPVSLLMVLFGSAVIAVGPVYLFVMPHLTHGAGLLTLIFAYSFVFSLAGTISPALKMGPLVMFVTMTGIANQQSYSFIGLANGAMMILMAQGIVTIVYLLFVPSASPVRLPSDTVPAQAT